MTLKMRERYQDRKRRFAEYKGSRCERCGYDRSLAALEFHHTDPAKKEFQISGPSVSWEATRAELDKCQLLCANCHREEHERLVQEKHKRLEEVVRGVIPRRQVGDGWVRQRCEGCGEAFDARISERQRYCSRRCKAQHALKIPWPTDEVLREMVWLLPIASLARDLGVSDAAVKKRCRTRSIQTPGKGYWTAKT